MEHLLFVLQLIVITITLIYTSCNRKVRAAEILFSVLKCLCLILGEKSTIITVIFVITQLELADLDVNMFSAVNNSLINDGCGLFRGRLILPYEHLSRFQNDVID